MDSQTKVERAGKRGGGWRCYSTILVVADHVHKNANNKLCKMYCKTLHMTFLHVTFHVCLINANVAIKTAPIIIYITRIVPCLDRVSQSI